MKLIRKEGENFQFRVARREREVLRTVLEAYPMTPPGHHRLSRAAASPADPNQALLDEAIASLKQEWQKRLQLFLANSRRFAADGSGYRLTLTREEIEWLLPVLNDVRVGSWVRLGCPDFERATDANDLAGKSPEALRYAVLMEVAAQLQFCLLAATDGTEGLGWGGRAA